MNDTEKTNFDFIHGIIEKEPDEYFKSSLRSIERETQEAEKLVALNQIDYKKCFMALDAACDKIANFYVQKLMPGVIKKKRPGKDEIWKNERYIADWEGSETDRRLYIELFKLKDEANSVKHAARGTITYPESYTDETGKLLLKRDDKGQVVFTKEDAEPEKYATLRNADIRLENLFDYCCAVLVKCGYISTEALPIYKSPERMVKVPEKSVIKLQEVLDKVDRYENYAQNENSENKQRVIDAEDPKSGKGKKRIAILLCVAVAVIIAFAALLAVSRMRSLSAGPASSNEQSVYYSKIIPYTESGQYESYTSSSDVSTEIDVDEAFALLSFIRNDSPDTAVVEHISCEFEEITEITEPNVKADGDIVDNILKVYVVNDGQAASPALNADIWSGDVSINDFATEMHSTAIEALEPGGVAQLAEYSFDPDKYMEYFPDGSSTLTVFINDLALTDIIIQYDPVTGEFSAGGGIGDGTGSIKLFSVLDVDAAPQSISFSTDEVTTIDDALRIETVIAPTKSCRVVVKGSYSVNGENKVTDEYTATVRVPIYAKDSFGNHGIMTQEMAKEPNNDAAHLLQIARKYLYDPESLNPNK